jgi:magnesium chelatase subunit D
MMRPQRSRRAKRHPSLGRTAHPESDPDETDALPEAPLNDLVLSATAAAIPAGLLAELRAGPAGRVQAPGQSGSGAEQRDRRRGRPAGSMRGEPTRGARLNVVETLRAAAPWQPMRREGGSGGARIAVRRDDFRITRLKRRTETTTVFVVDASGSAAFHRLSDAKGAIELLLADCYVRRDRVALMSFRGTGAELLLPPTRSLTRAKRSLAALPGGGGTPLATAIDEAATLADTIARQGGSAVLVFLTDGRANVARDGAGGRERASTDAISAARRLRSGSATILFIDTSPRPHAPAAAIAAAMGARYVPLPSADPARLSGIVRGELAAALPGQAGR